MFLCHHYIYKVYRLGQYMVGVQYFSLWTIRRVLNTVIVLMC